MTDDRYMTFKFDKKLIDDVDKILEETKEYKNRTDFIYTAIKEWVEVTRIKNSLEPTGRSIFRDLLVKKRIEAFKEVESIHGTCEKYYTSGADITPKGYTSPGTTGKPIPTPPAKHVSTKELKIRKEK